MGNNRSYIMFNDWLDLDKTSGRGNADVTLTALQNDGLEERISRLKIQGLNRNVYVNIKQNHLIPTITIENGVLHFSSFGGEQYVTINSNVLWDLGENNWVETDFVEGENNKGLTYLKVIVPPNGGDKKETEIPIFLRENHNEILGSISITQMAFDPTVEVPTDVENCFYIEPHITDGRVVNIGFGYSGESHNDGFNFLCDSYIYYYQNQKWNLLKVNPVYNEFGSLQIQKRVYFKEFYRRDTSLFAFLKFDIKENYNVGGDITTLLGPFKNPYGYNGLKNDNQRYASDLFAVTGIVDASKLVLPLKTSYNSHRAMFYGCTSLISAPELLAPILKEYCYYKMFSGCSNLNYIKMLGYESENIQDSLAGWVLNVAENGVFIKSEDVDLPIGIDGIPNGWTVYNSESVEIPEIPDTPDDENSEYFWIKLREDGNIYGLYDLYGHIYFSYDKINWMKASNESYIYGNANQTIYFKNNDPTWYRDYTSYVAFDVKGKVGGNLASLGRPNPTYKRMFYNNTFLVDASKLVIPSEYMTNSYCYEMFDGCSSLISAPQLPSVNLSEECYRGMFSGCSSLINAPQLSAIKLSKNCYRVMFYGCSSLVNAPQINATEMGEYSCFNMFGDCTSLQTAPELYATVLNKYCYYKMFNGCTNLSYIKMLATDISAADCLYLWVENVSPTGTFIKAANADLPIGNNGIPNGWAVQNA